MPGISERVFEPTGSPVRIYVSTIAERIFIFLSSKRLANTSDFIFVCLALVPLECQHLYYTTFYTAVKGLRKKFINFYFSVLKVHFFTQDNRGSLCGKTAKLLRTGSFASLNYKLFKNCAVLLCFYSLITYLSLLWQSRPRINSAFFLL